MKHLVLSFMTNQKLEDIEVFCSSLRKIYSAAECDIVLITNTYREYLPELDKYEVKYFSTISQFRPGMTFFMKLIRKAVFECSKMMRRSGLDKLLPGEVRDTYPLILEAWHHPHFARWFAKGRFLNLSRQYDQVFIGDYRDVAFQAPFFDSSSTEVSFFAECEPIGEPGFNTNWLRTHWGEAAYQRAIGFYPACLGTVLGPASQMREIVAEMTEFFALHPYQGPDQGITNHMLAEKLFNTKHCVVDNVSGAVATLSSEAARAMTLVKNGKICRVADGSVIPIVHMYDRYDDTKNLYDSAA